MLHCRRYNPSPVSLGADGFQRNKEVLSSYLEVLDVDTPIFLDHSST